MYFQLSSQCIVYLYIFYMWPNLTLKCYCHTLYYLLSLEVDLGRWKEGWTETMWYLFLVLPLISCVILRKLSWSLVLSLLTEGDELVVIKIPSRPETMFQDGALYHLLSQNNIIVNIEDRCFVAISPSWCASWPAETGKPEILLHLP